MLSEHLKCSLPLPTGHIVGKMHMSSKCTQHVITGFQAPLPPVRLSPNKNCWNRKSLHSFCNRERLWTTNSIHLQKAAQESLRLYDFINLTSQFLHMGSTFGALQASQPSADGQKEMRARPSDDHVRLRPPNLKAMGFLLEEVASKMDKSVASPKESQVTHPT